MKAAAEAAPTAMESAEAAAITTPTAGAESAPAAAEAAPTAWAIAAPTTAITGPAAVIISEPAVAVAVGGAEAAAKKARPEKPVIPIRVIGVRGVCRIRIRGINVIPITAAIACVLIVAGIKAVAVIVFGVAATAGENNAQQQGNLPSPGLPPVLFFHSVSP